MNAFTVRGISDAARFLAFDLSYVPWMLSDWRIPAVSKMSELHSDLETIRRIMEDDMGEPVLSAEDQIERKVDWLVREMDELCAMAANRETVDLIETNSKGVGHLCQRALLLARLLRASHPSQLRGVA